MPPDKTAEFASVKRLKGKLREIFRRGRGRNLGKLIGDELTPLLRGWMNYFRLAEVKGIFEELDSWIGDFHSQVSAPCRAHNKNERGKLAALAANVPI